MTHGDVWASPSVVAAVVTYALLGVVVAAWLSPRGGPFAALRGLDALVARLRWTHVLLLTAVAFVLFLPVHALTLAQSDDHAAHHELLIDHWRFFGPQADDVLAGENPYANLSHGDNHGLLRLWPTVLAVAAGGYEASAYFWTLTAFLVPPTLRWVAIESGFGRRQANYAALLALATPAALEMNAVMAQEDGLVAIAILVPLGLLQAGRPMWAALAAGMLAHVKFPTLFFTAPVFALAVAEARRTRRPLAPAFLWSVRHGLLAIAAFVPLFVVGFALYGEPYVRSILGVADPVHAPHQFAMQSFTLVDQLRHDPAARAPLVVLAAMTLLATLLYYYLGARRNDVLSATLLLVLGFYLTGYYLKEHYLSWGLPLLILWCVRTGRPERVLLPVAASVLLHAWAIAAGGLVPEEALRTVAAALLTLLMLVVMAALVLDLRESRPLPK